LADDGASPPLKLRREGAIGTQRLERRAKWSGRLHRREEIPTGGCWPRGRERGREREREEDRKLHRPDAKCRVNVIHAGYRLRRAQKKSPPSPTHSFRENCTVYSALSGCPAACPIAPSELRVRNKSLQRLLLYTRCVRKRYV
jgi:hypothetical protein